LNLFSMMTAAKQDAWAQSNWRGVYRRMLCVAFGHEVSNIRFGSANLPEKHCLCGLPILREDGSYTRIGHIVSCFLSGHRYSATGIRDGHREYVCERCGHPLLFDQTRSEYARHEAFHKKVRYRCNLFGHRAHEVTRRDGLVEYACHCGHSFLRAPQQSTVLKHPIICLAAGHFIKFVSRRNRYSEFRCRNCGHTFCFVSTEAGL